MAIEIGISPNEIKEALLNEAKEWSGDHRVSVWEALCSSAKKMNIKLSIDECHRAMKENTSWMP